MTITGKWTLYYDWNSTGNYSSTSMTVNAGGTWSNGQGSSGAWAQVAGLFTFNFNNLKTTYSGNWADRSITGICTTFAGFNGSFYMLQAGVSTKSLSEEKVAGHKNASGE
jgi:hypothetical protein